MEAFLWIVLPVFVAAGAALLSFAIMQARMEVALAKERESTADLRAALQANKATFEEKLRAAVEEARRKAHEEFLADIRVEERHYVRESKSLFVNKKSMVLQERLFFRNIPLSNWVEHEMVVEDGGNPQQLAQSASVFAARGLGAPNSLKLESPFQHASAGLAQSVTRSSQQRITAPSAAPLADPVPIAESAPVARSAPAANAVFAANTAPLAQAALEPEPFTTAEAFHHPAGAHDSEPAPATEPQFTTFPETEPEPALAAAVVVEAETISVSSRTGSQDTEVVSEPTVPRFRLFD